MGFVKLDCGLLDSTLWLDRCAREVFITALLMATPREIREPTPQLAVKEIKETGFIIQPGWYGFVAAAGAGIVNRSGVDRDSGIQALERLGEAEAESRTPDHEGRRLVRVDGGYIVLNFDKYRQKDHTAAERAKRYRERKAPSRVTNGTERVTARNVTQAEAEAEADNKEETASQSSSIESKSRSDRGVAFALWFKGLLPETVKVKDSDLDNWAKCYHEMIRLDSRTDLEIADVCKWARNDDFWKTNFLSPLKLRKKKDGITYFDNFKTKLTHEKTGKSNGGNGRFGNRNAGTANDQGHDDFKKFSRPAGRVQAEPFQVD